jgi:hypothetical protein
MKGRGLYCYTNNPGLDTDTVISDSIYLSLTPSIIRTSASVLVRGYPEITLVAMVGGGGGVSQNLTLANRWEGGVKEKLTISC